MKLFLGQYITELLRYLRGLGRHCGSWKEKDKVLSGKTEYQAIRGEGIDEKLC